ncbi:hypothetical protein [Leptolyngbya ohadii]|uniref:hypothetical protein n=1 Tax=Leptolyngbya ohadii TaxID=1962290 RepID=UPI000B59EBCE|nr:hypothetical protein [Leptolyngbya ohadii]
MAALIRQYKKSEAYQSDEYGFHQWYGNRSLTLEAAIDRAIRSEQCGKVHGHQCRVGRKRLNELAIVAQDHIERFRSARDWEEIYTIVGDMVAQVPGVGALAHYDIAHRIASYFRYEQTVLRVQAGALEGALKLGLKVQDGKVALDDLPPELRSLGVTHTENFLCVYKKYLKPLNR